MVISSGGSSCPKDRSEPVENRSVNTEKPRTIFPSLGIIQIKINIRKQKYESVKSWQQHERKVPPDETAIQPDSRFPEIHLEKAERFHITILNDQAGHIQNKILKFGRKNMH
jgi:hypothetical protein